MSKNLTKSHVMSAFNVADDLDAVGKFWPLLIVKPRGVRNARVDQGVLPQVDDITDHSKISASIKLPEISPA